MLPSILFNESRPVVNLKLYKPQKIRNKFNIIILISENVEPTTIEIGNNENNNKKKFSLLTRLIKKASTL